MPRSPQISGKEMRRVLTHLGFYLESQKGSHMKFVKKYQGGKEIIIVPNHKTLRKGTLNNLVKKLNLNTRELRKLL
jgi:predicted RNA binding protein YcfA (HicA-like mRNA interferase family)